MSFLLGSQHFLTDSVMYSPELLDRTHNADLSWSVFDLCRRHQVPCTFHIIPFAITSVHFLYAVLLLQSYQMPSERELSVLRPRLSNHERVG